MADTPAERMRRLLVEAYVNADLNAAPRAEDGRVLEAVAAATGSEIQRLDGRIDRIERHLAPPADLSGASADPRPVAFTWPARLRRFLRLKAYPC